MPIVVMGALSFDANYRIATPYTQSNCSQGSVERS